MRSEIGSNIWKLYAMKAVRGFLVMMPTIVLFFQENGLSMQEVFILQATFSASIMIFEIPSGYFADRFGRKNSLVAGSVLAFLSFVIYSFAFDFWTIFIAEIFLGLGYAFTSGADSALLYDTLVESGKTTFYRAKEGAMQSIFTFTEAMGSILGGYLALVSLRTPLIAQAAITFFLIPLAFSLREVTPKEISKEHTAWTMRRTVVHTLHENKALRWLIVYYGLITAAGLIIVWFRQPYLVALDIPLEYFGYIWAALMLSVSLTNVLADRFERTLGTRWSLATLCMLGVVGFALISTIGYWGIAALFVFCAMRGLGDPIVTNHLQQQAVPEVRATILSIKSFVGRGFFAVASPFIGWVSDAYSLQSALILSGLMFTLLCGLTLIALLLNERRTTLEAT